MPRVSLGIIYIHTLFHVFSFWVIVFPKDYNLQFVLRICLEPVPVGGKIYWHAYC